MKKIQEPNTELNVLCLEDTLKDAELLNEVLTDAGYQVSMNIAVNEKEYRSFLKSQNYDVILADYTLPGYFAPAALQLAKKLQPDVPFICFSGTIGEDKAVELLKQGATDYVLKDRPDRLTFAVRRALEGVALQIERNITEAEKLKIRNELQVHQAKLEVQNEELIQAKEKASIAAEKYIELYDFAPSGYFTISPEGEILEMNLSGAKMLGKERSQLKNRKFHLFISNNLKPVFWLFLEKVLNSSTKEICELTMLSDANPLLVLNLTGIASENGANCFITAVDITQHKKAEDALKKSEYEFHLLSESMPQIVWITDPNGLNTYFNQQWVDYTGQSLEDSYGTGWNKPFHPDDRQRAWDAWQNATQNNEKYSIECRLRRFDDSYKWWLLRGVPMRDERGTILKWFGTCTDIDELKNSEETLKIAKEHAEESDLLKSAFLANMSHEIRTPMNGILGFAQLLKEPNLTYGEQKQFLGIIEKSGARMLNIINAIVSISKIESGQMEISISETNVNEQMDFVYNFFKPVVEGNGMQLIAKNALPSKEAIIKSDCEKIYAILTNLIGNATKFTQTGSIEFGYEKKGKYLEFFVKDTGVGIADEKKGIIFERFRQGSESMTRSYEGAGLGLSISKAYVEMLGGKIWVESELGNGSTFYFTIPYNAEKEPEIITKEPVSTGDKDGLIKNLKILIAEDDESSEMFLSTALTKFDKELLIARTGVEAVEICRNNPDIDLVMMDMRMPDMDGYEATLQIREFNKDVVIIAQTAYGLLGDRQKAIEAGCTDYISKPINITLLKAIIQKHCNK